MVRTVISKDIFTDGARSAAHVFKDPPVVNGKDTDRTIPRDRNAVEITPRSTTPVCIGTGPLIYPTRMGRQYIGSPKRSISPQEVSNAEPFNTSINGIYSKHRDSESTWSKLTGSKLSNKSSVDVYLRCRMNLLRETVLTKIPNFMDLGLSSVHTTDELGSVFIPTTRIGSLTHGTNWLLPGHCISEDTADRVSGTRPEKNII